MVRQCYITNFNSNCKVKTFRLPEIQKKERWKTIIPRDKMSNSSDTAVCAKHWAKDYLKTIDYEKLHACNLCSVFDCIKSSLFTTAPSAQKNL